MRGRHLHRILDPDRLVMDFLLAEERKVGSHGSQMDRLRYWDTLLSRLFSIESIILVCPLPDGQVCANTTPAE